MIKINDTINFEAGIALSSQNETFQTWFNENILPNIDFVNTCSERDAYGRPLTWSFPQLSVTATYFIQNQNYNFNTFIINGTI
jgi:hypothetical protein